MKYDIRSIEDLINVLGGDTKVARWLGISQPAVSAFKRRGIPGGWHMRFYAETRRRGLTVDPEVFGLSEEDMAPLFGRDEKDQGPLAAMA